MRKVSMATRAELILAIRGRYASAGRPEKAKILGEFVALTGFHRKHAMRLLRGSDEPAKGGARLGRRIYGDAVRAALVLAWEASDRICGKRLHPLLPLLIEAMERHGHGGLDGQNRQQLLAMSAATIDRILTGVRASATGQRRRKGSTAIRRSVPVRTFSDWNNPAPGFVEADLMAHSGPFAKGAFTQTLVLTDIATGWTECAPLLVREQTVLTVALTELRKLLPFALLGFDTDNDSVFMNETVRDYCLRENIELTRCRPYRKNDQAFVEQKNGAIVRKIVGYRRFEGLQATRELARLYASTRLFVNFFQPSFKLKEKHRDGAKVIKRYHRPATPYQRLLADPLTPEETRRQLTALSLTLDPVLLLRDIRLAQQELAESKYRFDDAEHWFRDLFAQRIELPAFWRFQPMRHGLDRRWVFRRGRWIGEALGQRWMMRLSAHGDQRLDPCRLAGRYIPRAEIAGIGQQRFGLAQFFRQGVDLAEHRFELLLVVRGLNNIDGNHQKTALRHCSLRVVALLETAAGYRHDARLFVGEIDLIGKQRTLRRGPRRLAALLLVRGRSLGLPRFEFGLMLGLLAREAFFAASLDLRTSFGASLQTISAPRQLVGY